MSALKTLNSAAAFKAIAYTGLLMTSLTMSACTTNTTKSAQWEKTAPEFVKERYASAARFDSTLSGAAINKGHIGHSLSVKRKNLEGLEEVEMSSLKER